MSYWLFQRISNYLGVKVGVDPEMTLRYPLTAVGHTLRPKTPENAGACTIIGFTASLLAVTNAVVAMWPRPALALVACFRGRVRDNRLDRALRVAPQSRNDIARQETLYVIPNMRVPQASIVYDVFHSGNDQTDFERCEIWETSDGTRLPDHKVLISATRIGEQVYCVMSM